MKVVMVAEAGSARLRRGGGWLGGRGRKSWGTLGLAWILNFGFGFGFFVLLSFFRQISLQISFPAIAFPRFPPVSFRRISFPPLTSRH